MKNTKRVMYKTTILIRTYIVLLILSSALVSQQPEKAAWERPLEQCWQYRSRALAKNPLASDNVSTILITETPALITAIDATKGHRLWAVEAGLQISSSPILANDWVHVVSKFGDLTGDRGELRVSRIDLDTGISAAGAPVPFPAGSRYQLGAGTIVVINRAGVISVFDFEGRLLANELASSGSTIDGISQSGPQLYIWSSSGIVRRITFKDSGNNVETVSFSIEEEPSGAIVEDEGRIYGGTVSGYVVAIASPDGDLLWRSRTGGAIDRIESFEQDLLVLSKDNFLYRLSKEDGKRVWKRKLAGRILGGIAVDEAHHAFLSMGSNEITIVRMDDGKIVNSQVVPGASYFIGSPILVNGMLVVPHDQGLTAFAAKSTCGKQ